MGEHHDQCFSGVHNARQAIDELLTSGLIISISENYAVRAPLHFGTYAKGGWAASTIPLGPLTAGLCMLHGRLPLKKS